MPRQFDTYLIEKNAFLCAGIKTLLEEANFMPIIEFKSIQDVDKAKNHQNCGLVVLGAETCLEQSIPDCIYMLHTTFSKAKIVVLASNLNLRLIKACFSAGVDGFILDNISPNAFLQSLDLVLLGEKVYPTNLADFLLNEPINDSLDIERDDNCSSLSDRENQIVDCLIKGESNKMIARDLDITESTVKVHIKAILRKLGLKNRTQVAIWATNNGHEHKSHSNA